MSHKHGIQSFIDNGVRPSLIPILLSYFQDRTMKVKWSNGISSPRPLPGGTPQGGTLGILEFNSQCNNNTDFLNEEEKFKFIDDLSFLEVLNLLMASLGQYDCKYQIPSDVGIDDKFIPGEYLQSQSHLKLSLN